MGFYFVFNVIEFKFVHEVCIDKLKQTKTNLQKYVVIPPLLFKLPYICARARAMPRAKKKSAKGSN